MRLCLSLSSLACALFLSLTGTAHAQSAAPPPPETAKPVEPPQTPQGAAALASPFPPAFPGQTNGPVVVSQTRYKVTTIASGFNYPWAIAFLPDGRMLVTEKPTGKLYIVTQQGAKSAPVAGLPPVDGRGQGGLMDVEVGPDYAQSRYIYWSYYEPREAGNGRPTAGNGLAVARGKLVDGPQPRIEALQIIFRMKPTLDSTLHAGGRIVFHPDGTLFVTLGERSILPGRVQARQLNSHFGKIVRIFPDGTVPSNNPFYNQVGARSEIFSLGHRNILAAALDSRGRLWEAEMGPLGGDELNLVERGKDYGWPTIGYGTEYSGAPIHQSGQGPGMEQPVYFWNPVVSPSGMTIYSGSLFPEWQGNIFIGALSGHALIRLVLQDDRVVGEERLKPANNARVREVVQGPEGALYLLTDDPNGRLLKMTPQ
ncbi:PQQ-dependent sugar dehydrogenase [Myxococcus sp. XM-1-1-1]|uniref:PQQ-dependent sugar dehydrogenase n=1 Tax=Myxococcus sp. XM-1-1-1 TaxID=2874602 RepID=UPI001CBBB975|nr:PQQ-dependent sugar dehydrogenase [Myxococcus sp. XM-1-1-1]MBZ4408768.1 PQQ-dependent sugar dehydrogenase [Myxococcus sp. XM-1-1-1]